MPLVIETYKKSSAAVFSGFPEWPNQYAIDPARVYDHINVYDMAKSIASAEAHFLGNHVSIPYALSYSVSWDGRDLGDLQYHDFARAQISGYGYQPNPLGPEWAVKVNKSPDTGRGGAWMWRGVCDESDTTEVTHLTRKWARAANAEKVMEVWWRYRLGDIADAFLTLRKEHGVPLYVSTPLITFGGIACLANQRKFYQYRDGEGWTTRTTQLKCIADVQSFVRTIKEEAPLNGEYNPPGWRSYAALLLFRMATVAGDTVKWMYNPNQVMTPCTKPCPMVSRFGITLAEALALIVPINSVTCDIAVAGVIEGVSAELTKKVRDDTAEVIATETYVDEVGTEYMTEANAYKLLTRLEEYLAIIQPLARADYLNAVNNLAPGYRSGTPSERFTGRRKSR